MFSLEKVESIEKKLYKEMIGFWFWGKNTHLLHHLRFHLLHFHHLPLLLHHLLLILLLHLLIHLHLHLLLHRSEFDRSEERRIHS